MKYSATTIRHLIALCNGSTVADSKLNGEIFRHMKDENMLIAITHGSRKSWRARNCESLRFYLNDTCGLRDLDKSLSIAIADSVSRSAQVQAFGDSKFKSCRSFKGFMVNCYHTLHCTLNGKPIQLHPQEGIFSFIYDFESFCIPEDAIVVGIENFENFRYIREQEFFFKKNISGSSPLLFVSRYPQIQHSDLIKWLKVIPNRYIHFGDLDLAGVKIYLTEYFPYLGQRSSFLIPLDYDDRIAAGSTERYNMQLQFSELANVDPRLMPLISSIHRHHRGYDQEGFIIMCDNNENT